jgi:hypothetical protein
MSSRTARKKCNRTYIARRRKSYILLSSSASFNGDHHHLQHTHSMSSRTAKNPTEDILQEEERATFWFLQALPSMRRKSSSEKHERKECNFPQKKTQQNIVHCKEMEMRAPWI